jgi:hypothetical protein
MFETRIPTNSASFHEPKVIVSTPKTNRIPFGIVSVLARTMLKYERLVRARCGLPRASRRRPASASVRPPVPVPVPSTIC